MNTLLVDGHHYLSVAVSEPMNGLEWLLDLPTEHYRPVVILPPALSEVRNFQLVGVFRHSNGSSLGLFGFVLDVFDYGRLSREQTESSGVAEDRVGVVATDF